MWLLQNPCRIGSQGPEGQQVVTQHKKMKLQVVPWGHAGCQWNLPGWEDSTDGHIWTEPWFSRKEHSGRENSWGLHHWNSTSSVERKRSPFTNKERRGRAPGQGYVLIISASPRVPESGNAGIRFRLAQGHGAGWGTAHRLCWLKNPRV